MLCIHQELSDNPSDCSASSSPYTGEPLNGAARRMSAAAPEPPLCKGRWAAGPEGLSNRVKSMLCIHQELSDNPSGCSASSSPYTGEPLNGAARRMSAAAPEPPLCKGRWAAGPEGLSNRVKSMLCIHQELSDNPSGCSASSSPYTGEPLNGAVRRMSAAAPEPPLCEGRWAAGPEGWIRTGFPASTSLLFTPRLLSAARSFSNKAICAAWGRGGIPP